MGDILRSISLWMKLEPNALLRRFERLKSTSAEVIGEFRGSKLSLAMASSINIDKLSSSSSAAGK